LWILLWTPACIVDAQTLAAGFFVKELFGCSMCYSKMTAVANYRDVCDEIRDQSVDIAGLAIEPTDMIIPPSCRCQGSSIPLLSVPMIGTAMVLAYHDPGCAKPSLKLPNSAIAGIYNGNITNWNQLEGCANVDLPITLCERCDNSMQQAAFTRSLKCMGVEIPNEPCCAPGVGFSDFMSHATCASVGGSQEGDCVRGGQPRANRVHGDIVRCTTGIRGSIAAFRYCDFLMETSGAKAFQLQTAGGRWVKPTRHEVRRGVHNSNCGNQCLPTDGWPIIVIPRMMYRSRGYGSQASTIRSTCKDTVRNNCFCGGFDCYFPIPRACRMASLEACRQIAA